MTKDIVLVESRSAREDQMSEMVHERAQGILDKVKGILFALWKGDSIASTNQIADFYEVDEDTIRQVVSRHRDEFESDGLKVLRGKDLRDVRDMMSLTQDTPKALAWTPRATLRLGMLLRDSLIAKQVRTTLIDLVQHGIPAQAERLKELELELQLIKAKQKLIDTKHLITATMPTAIADRILGVEVVKEVEYRDRVLKGDEVIRNGRTLNKGQLCRKLGILNRNGNPDYKALDRFIQDANLPSEAWELTAIVRDNVELRDEYLNELTDRWQSYRRQGWLAESIDH